MRHAVALIAVVSSLVMACSGASGASASDAGESSDASGDHASGDAGAAWIDDSSTEPYETARAPSLGGVRVANWSADAPPVDFCIALEGTSEWKGPILASAGPQGSDGGAFGLTFTDGGLAGLAYPGVTSYFYFAPGRYDTRFVAAGSSDCSVPVAPDDDEVPSLSENGLVTIALLTDPAGDAGQGGFRIKGLTDDVDVPASVASGRIALRFINAAPSAQMADFGVVAVNTVAPPFFALLFSQVPYGQAGTLDETTEAPPYADDNGYLFTFALNYGSAMRATDVQMDQATLAEGAASVATGTLVTAVLLAGSSGTAVADAGSGAEAGRGLELLSCEDNAGTTGLGGACRIISE